MVEPLPLAELLEVLRSRHGLPIGLREHMALGRLLERWDEPDPATLCAAVTALLARSEAEARLVRETFDLLYAVTPPSPLPPPPLGWRERFARAWARLRRTLWGRRLGWGLAAALMLAIGLWLGSRAPLPPADPPVEIPYEPLKPQKTERRPPPPPPPTETRREPDLAWRAALGLVGAGALFLWLYRVRTRRQARRRARSRWGEEAAALPEPRTYELSLPGLAPALPQDTLEDAATLLGRRVVGAPHTGELDVTRTIDRTLRQGGLLQPVFRPHGSTQPLLVLEDVADEMRPWRRRIAALLDGLAARGVALDHWRFHADAGRVFRDPDGPSLPLRQLFRMRAESPLLVISTGAGLLDGEGTREAAWVKALRQWTHLAWLHPVPDPRAWRQPLRCRKDVWPLTAAGVLAVARRLARGFTRSGADPEARQPTTRRMVPLDVDRLRWLLSLARRREPELAELLRQHFCPQVPEAALVAALNAPPLLTHPGAGPAATDVHRFLVDVLDVSAPPVATAAYDRWRLDRAIQGLQVAELRDEAFAELRRLAAGPLGGELEQALLGVGPLPPALRRRLNARILAPLRRRAAREGLAVSPGAVPEARRMLRPTWGEVATGVALGTGLYLVAPHLGPAFSDEVTVKPDEAYLLDLGDPIGDRGRWLKAESLPGKHPPPVVQLYQDQDAKPALRFELNSLGQGAVQAVAGHWYQLQAKQADGGLLVSNQRWVPAVKERSGQDGSGQGRREPVNPASPNTKVYQRVRSILVEQLNVAEKEVVPQASLVDDLRADSLDLVQTLLALQEKFGVQITVEDAAKLKTVGDIVSYISREAPRSALQREVRKTPPYLEAIEPSSGIPGSVIKVAIKNLRPGAQVTLSSKSGGTERAPYSKAAAAIRVGVETSWIELTIPAKAEIGPLSVTVTNPDGQSSSKQFTVEPRPNF